MKPPPPTPDAEPLDLALDERLYEILGEWDESRQRGPAIDIVARFHADPLLAPRPELLVELLRRCAALDRFAAVAEEEHLPHVPGLELLHRIGHGGMGVVYRAWDPALRRIVAIKMVRGGRFAHPDQRRRFQNEARKLASLDHPNLIKVHGTGDVDDQSYFVMEYHSGGDLKSRWARERQPPRAAAELVESLARGMHTAHCGGIVHRDLKPSNILLAADGMPKIADFGLAKDLNDDAGLTRTADVMGTEAYMSPEQFERGGVDARTDVYGLGGILYEALTGRPPFEPAPGTPLIDQIRHQPPAPPRRLAPVVDLDLQTICLKCLEKDPQRRYATAEALADELHRWLAGDPILARPPGAARHVARWCRQHPWWSAGAAALLVFVPLMLIVLTVATVRITAARNLALELKQQSDASAELALQREELAEARRYQLQVRMAVEALEEGRTTDVLQGFEDKNNWEGRRLQLEAELRAPDVIRWLYAHRWGILDALVTRDGHRLVTAGADGMLLVWDLETGRIIRRLAEGRWSDELRRHLHYCEGWIQGTGWPPPTLCPVGLCWLNDERSIAVASLDGRGLWFDVESGEQRPLHQSASPLLCVAAQPRAGQILFGAEDGGAYLIDAEGALQQTAHFKSAVVAARWFEAGRSWIIGCRQGELFMLDERTLAVHARLGLEAPLWGFETRSSSEGDLLAVAVQQPRLAMIHMSASPRGFNLANSIEVPSGASPATGIHSVCFGTTADDVYALDDLGRLVSWDRSRGQLRWIQEVLSNEQLLRTVEKQAAAHGWPLPACLKKSGVVAAGWSQPEQIVTGTRDLTALLWQISTSDGKRRLSLAAPARVCFDPRQSDVLWTLTEDGILNAYNVAPASPELVGSVAAHQGGGVALASLAALGGVLTTGQDGIIRSWRIDDQRIVSGERNGSTHRGCEAWLSAREASGSPLSTTVRA